MVWLDGIVDRILPSCTDADLKAIFSFDAGDSYASYTVRAEATATPWHGCTPDVARGNEPRRTPRVGNPPMAASPTPAHPAPAAAPSAKTAQAKRERCPSPMR